MSSRTTIRAVIVSILFFCCQQESHHSLVKLSSFTDSKFRYRIQYERNYIKEIHIDSGTAFPYKLATYTYSNNYIRADLHPSTGYSYVEYFLKNRSLPVSIRKHMFSGGTDTIISRVDFFYSSGGSLPDSVVLQSSSRFNFIPIYRNNNISDYYISTDFGPRILSGSFLYYPEINVFRQTNPLLFVYSNPVFQFESFMLPRIFSAQTIKKFNGGTFLYNTDRKGNLAIEDYGPSVFPYRRVYNYD